MANENRRNPQKAGKRRITGREFGICGRRAKAEAVPELYEDGDALEDLMAEPKLSRAFVCSQIPYRHVRHTEVVSNETGVAADGIQREEAAAIEGRGG